MKLSLQLKLGQQLTMTPQLQQAIRLLQLPLLELNAQLEQALAENVMLESEEPEQPVQEIEQPQVVAGEGDESSLWSDVPRTGGRSDPWSDDSRRPELADHSGETLHEHLLWQLEMEHFTPREVVIGQMIIDELNDDGYLMESLENIQQTLHPDAEFSVEEIEKALLKLQTLDPVGIAARTLGECI